MSEVNSYSYKEVNRHLIKATARSLYRKRGTVNKHGKNFLEFLRDKYANDPAYSFLFEGRKGFPAFCQYTKDVVYNFGHLSNSEPSSDSESSSSEEEVPSRILPPLKVVTKCIFRPLQKDGTFQEIPAAPKAAETPVERKRKLEEHIRKVKASKTVITNKVTLTPKDNLHVSLSDSDSEISL